MKKQILLGLSTLMLSSVVMAQTIGVINTAVIFKEHPLYAKMDQQFQKDFADKKMSVADDKKLIENLEMELAEKIANKKIGKAAIKKEEIDIENKKMLLAEKERILNGQIKTALDNGRLQILQDVQEKSKEYALNNNIDLVVDTGSVVFYKDNQDITKKVIEFIISKQK